MRIVRPIGLVLLLLLVAITTACDGGRSERLFTYDDDAPLSIQVADSWQNGNQRVISLSYASPMGGRVPALIVVPPGHGPFAGLIVQHGLPGDRFAMLQVAEDFARLGAVVVAIDAPWARAKHLITFTKRDRTEQIQLIIDLRRAVDLLRSRDDVDDDRIGYLGVSYGAAMGGLLAGVEDRIAAFVLNVGDGGLVTHFTGAEDAQGPLSQLPAARLESWLAAMEPIEPLKWIGKAEAPILFQSGRDDDLVPPADAKEFHRAAPETKEVRWYNAGHLLPNEAWCDAARWLQETIAVSGNKHPACD
jgi:dienelactone hydrolase